MKPSSSAPKPTLGLWIASLITFGLLAWAAFAFITHGDSNPRPPAITSVGQEATLNTQLLATSVEAFNALQKVRIAGDNIGIRQLGDAGVLFAVEPNARVLVIDRGGTLGSLTEVRIMTGINHGRAGWVESENVRTPAN